MDIQKCIEYMCPQLQHSKGRIACIQKDGSIVRLGRILTCGRMESMRELDIRPPKRVMYSNELESLRDEVEYKRNKAVMGSEEYHYYRGMTDAYNLILKECYADTDN